MSIYLNHVTNNITASSGNVLINGFAPQVSNVLLTSIIGLGTTSTGYLKLTNGVASLDNNSFIPLNGNLDIPSGGNLVNCTGYKYTSLSGTTPTWNQNTTGTASGLSSTLAVTSGGTGTTTLTSNSVILGNGTNSVKFVAPGVNGNILVSNGTTWVSSSALNAALPSQSGNGGKYLSTNGSDAFWGATTGAGNVVLSSSPYLSLPTITALREVKVAVTTNNIDLLEGNYFTKTIISTSTLTVSNVPASNVACSFILDLTNGGSSIITWWPNVKSYSNCIRSRYTWLLYPR